MMNRSKWRIRKQGGEWQIWPPHQIFSEVQLATFDAVVAWCQKRRSGQ